MILSRNKNITFNSHLKIFKTNKEFKKILPFGYIQTKLSSSNKYSFNNNHRLKNLEKEKRLTRINNNLLHNNKIRFIISEDNENTKKIIYNLKKYYLNKNPRNIFPIKSESNIINKNKNTFDILKNLNFTNKKEIYNKKYGFNEKEKNKNLIKNDILINSNSYSGNFFKSSSINNCIMKNNIYLPSMTNRMKNSMPRYQRQNKGFILNGIGKNSLKEIKINIFKKYNKNKLNEINEKNIILRKIIFIKNKNAPSYAKSYDIKNDSTILNNIIKSKKKYKTKLYKKNIKIDDNIE